MKRLAYLCLIALPLLLTGCFMLPTEAHDVPTPTREHPEARPLPTVAVGRGDVRNVASLEANYVPPRLEVQQFSVTAPVAGIFVSVGGTVREGDIIAALYLPEVQEQREVLGERRAWIEFELQFINERRELTISLAGEPVATPYDAPRAELLEELEFIEHLLETLEQLNEERYLLASKDGVLTQVFPFSDTLVANPQTRIATISNEALTAFVVDDPLTVLMSPGQRFEMTLGGLYGWVHIMEVVNPEDFGFYREEGYEERSEAFLIFVEEPPDNLNDRSRGFIHIELEEVQDVLYIPLSSLHQVGTRSFVYVIENGLRVLRDVEIGLMGGGLVEIISGLEEGELIAQ